MDHKEANEIIQLMLQSVRHCQVLGMELVSFDNRQLILKLPYSENIVGNPDSGVIHGGALTTLMDTTCGFVVPVSLEAMELCPTLDLRIDYMTAAAPGQPVFARSEVFRITDNIVFSRGVAYQEDPSKPIAHCVATFMRIKDARDNKQGKAQ